MAYNVAIQCHKIRKAYIADVEKVFWTQATFSSLLCCWSSWFE